MTPVILGSERLSSENIFKLVSSFAQGIGNPGSVQLTIVAEEEVYSFGNSFSYIKAIIFAYQGGI